MHPALAQRFPDLQAHLPWRPIGRWPTPVSRLARLEREAGRELWLKDDGLSHGVMAGNKVRKLEPLLAAALERGARRVLTVGGTGSNHVLATAYHARELGLACAAVIFPQPPGDDEARVRELVAALGVEQIPIPNRLAVPWALARAMAADRAGTYLIGPGGSSPLGTLGFVAGALELAGQVEAGLLPCPAEVVVALGSGGSAAGILLGLAVVGLPCRVVAVRVVERPLAGAWLVRRLARRAARLLRWPGRLGELEVVHGEAGPGYGAPTEAALRAVALCRESEGLRLETTYTGKAMAALLARRSSRDPVLFWNTHNSRDLAGLV